MTVIIEFRKKHLIRSCRSVNCMKTTQEVVIKKDIGSLFHPPVIRFINVKICLECCWITTGSHRSPPDIVCKDLLFLPETQKKKKEKKKRKQQQTLKHLLKCGLVFLSFKDQLRSSHEPKAVSIIEARRFLLSGVSTPPLPHYDKLVWCSHEKACANSINNARCFPHF